ncbi:PleD family two-component system response regulator [Candidatus Omnitrophota bacterium]
MDKRKVMVIDDEQDVLQLTKLALEGTGEYEVLTLTDAKDIIGNLHKFKPDIILLDIRMPHIGGIEACEMLNKDSVGKNTPVIFVSILEADRDKLDAYKAGAVDYIAKSAEKEELIYKIEKALQDR